MEKKKWFSEIFPTIQENFFEMDSLKEMADAETNPKEKDKLSIEIEGLLLTNKWLSHSTMTSSLKDCIDKIYYLESIYEYPQFQSFVKDFKVASITHQYLENGDLYIDDFITTMDSNSINLHQNIELLEEKKFQDGKRKMKEFFEQEDIKKLFLDWDSSFFSEEGKDAVSSYKKIQAIREAIHNLKDFRNKVLVYENKNTQK